MRRRHAPMLNQRPGRARPPNRKVAMTPIPSASSARRRATGAAVALAALLAVTGCSSDDSGSGTADPAGSGGPAASGESADAGGLETAARDTAQMLIDADYGAAYGRLSVRCQAAVPVEEFIAQATEGADMAQRMGVDLSSGVITDVTTEDVTATDGRANVVVEVDGESDDMGVAPFVYEDGQWRLDDCGDPEASAP
jgi:hypothetical protein